MSKKIYTGADSRDYPESKPQTLGEKYPCPKCGSSRIMHTMKNSFCQDCDYDSETSDLEHPMGH